MPSSAVVVNYIAMHMTLTQNYKGKTTELSITKPYITRHPSGYVPIGQFSINSVVIYLAAWFWNVGGTFSASKETSSIKDLTCKSMQSTQNGPIPPHFGTESGAMMAWVVTILS